MTDRIREDDGAVSAMVTVLAMVAILVAGLALDGGRVLEARREAADVADNAARAAAQAVDVVSTRGGVPRVDAGAAARAAAGYRTSVGHGGFTQVTADTVEVTVHIDVPMLLLGAAGVGAKTVTATGAARIVRGVSTGET